MALRAILRRKRSPLKFLGQPGCSAHISSSSECKQSSFAPDPWSSTSSLCHLPPDDDSRKDRRLFWLTREKLVVFSAADLLQQNSNAYPAYRSITGIPQYVQSLRSTPKESIRYASTAAASQPEPHGDNNENEEKVFSQVKEPSPEQCDQAVEGLSSAKAKAKVKQLQDYQKEDKPLMQRVWATLLGIGPAFRVVASMSREDWAKKLVHWKDEFKSAMQHYWLGTKLLWVDVRISMRLLLKLANGKNLSRRERKQLTRTTADIFRLVPFAVFIIVPFMEFLLPVALKLFPDMLPSTFKDKMKEQNLFCRKT